MAGPDGPTIDFLVKNIELVEKMVPHDGIALHVDAQGMRNGKAAIANRHNIFRNWKWEKEWFIPSLMALKKVKFKKLTDNFIYTASTNADFDMFNDKAWKNVCNNFRLMAWYAREAGLKGLFLTLSITITENQSFSSMFQTRSTASKNPTPKHVNEGVS